MKKKTKLLSIAIAFLIAASTISTVTVQTKSAASGLVGYWNFNEGSGSIAHDLSGNGNDGTVQSGTLWVNGKSGTALEFDGVSGFVLVSDSNSLHISSTVTVAAWIYLPAGADYSGGAKIVSKAASNGGTNLDFGIWNNSRYVDFGVGTDGGTNAVIMTSNNAIPTNAWTYVAGTYDGSTLKIYINGNLDSSQPFSGGIDTNNGRPLTIGKNNFYPWSNEYWFNGTIDEVRICNTALSQQEIQAIMGNSTTPIWMQWWFWTIIALGASVVVLASTTAHYRKKPIISKEASAIQNKTIQRANKVCPKCGANLPADSKFCGKCGTSLE